MPDLSEDQTLILLKERQRAVTVLDSFNGLINLKLAKVLLKEARIKFGREYDLLSDDELIRLRDVICHFTVEAVDFGGYDKAQTTSGGVDLAELTDELESKLIRGLYFCGEVVDVDGRCGGYNLQWAFASGYAAGKSAGNL